MKHEIQFTVKSNGSLPENNIKNEIDKMLLKSKFGNDIHEHGTAKRINYIKNVKMIRIKNFK